MLINCVFIWERPVKEIHCTWSIYVNSHESTGINENKPGILCILVFTLKTELKYSCGGMNCSIMRTWKTRIQCKNTWISMPSHCHMHTVHSAQLPAGQLRPHLLHALCILQSHAQMICRTLAYRGHTCEPKAQHYWSHTLWCIVLMFNSKP